MKNEVKDLFIKDGVLGKVTAIGTPEERNLYINGKRRNLRAYPISSEGVVTATVYVPVTRGETNIKMGDELILENPILFPMQARIGRTQFYDNVIVADSVTKGSASSPLKGTTLKQRLSELKFHKGDITDFIDVKKSFGDLMYMAHSTVYYYDEDEGIQTEKVTGHEMIVLSEVAEKTYTVKFNDPKVDLTSMDHSTPMQEVVEFEGLKVTLYIDTRQTNQGATVSIEATGIVIPTLPDANKPPVQNEKKPNDAVNKNNNNKQGQQS